MTFSEKINYLEYAAKDIPATKTFFEVVFGWQFMDYGPEYTAFNNQGVEGGFYQSDLASLTENGGALTVFLSDDIDDTQARIVAAGGQISTPTFDFPGGKRFHFLEPSGNEFAVWTHT